MAGQARFTFTPIDLLPLLTQRAVAQLGSALVWGTRGRGFKSRQPDWDMWDTVTTPQVTHIRT